MKFTKKNKRFKKRKFKNNKKKKVLIQPKRKNMKLLILYLED